jgi:CBS domain-containing protein
MTIARIIALKGTDVATTQPHRTLGEAAEQLTHHNIGALVVTDLTGRVLGILSERDIIRALSRRSAAALDDAVSQHMTAKVMTTSLDECVSDVVARMNRGRFRHMPVLSDDGTLSGIVSIGDLVKYRIEEIEHEHSALREYIATA